MPLEDGNLIDHTQKEVTYKDFVDKASSKSSFWLTASQELVLFAKANVGSL